MSYCLDVLKAYESGFIQEIGGLFRGETALIVDDDEDSVTVTLPNSLNPEKEYVVSWDCIMVQL